MKKYDVLSVGVATLDYLLTGIGDDLLKEDSVVSKESLFSPGGDGLNTAVSLHRLGLSVLFSGCIGDDDNGKLLKSKMEEQGLSTEGFITLQEARTSSPVILIEKTGERHIIRASNSANGFLTDTMISDRVLDECRHLHVGSANVLRCLDGEPLGKLFERAKKKGMTTSLDVSYAKDKSALESVRYALPYCDIFLPSIVEAREITVREDVEEMVEVLLSYPIRILGIKLGEKGVFLTDRKQKIFLPSLYQGRPMDTTGAGDAFVAGFLAGYLEGLDLSSCGLMGSSQSCSVMSDIGASKSAGNREENLQRIHDAGYTLKTIEGKEYGNVQYQ